MDLESLADDAFDSLGRLASGIGHSVNNPLTTVLLNLALVQRELEALPPDRQSKAQKLLDATQVAAKEVREGLRHLRGCSRWRDELAEIDICAMLDTIAALVAYATPPSVEIHRDYGPVPTVYGRENRLAHGLLALVHKALADLPDDAERRTIVLRVHRGDGDPVIVEIAPQEPGRDALRIELSTYQDGI